ncbi:MAG: hypothetical protein ABI763_07305 [Bacteroidota bacterium]
MFQIVTESPAWLSVFCILAGALLTFFLYRKDKNTGDIKSWLRWLMMTFRFVVITLLAFLLLSPLIRTMTRQTEKPIIIVAQDNSQSIVTNKDSSFYRKKYVEDLKTLVNELSQKYEVKTLTFGDKVDEKLDLTFNEKQTDFTGLMDEVEVRYANRNVGALILASDGLYNKGSNPLYHSQKVPVYAIALGDTTAQKDLIVGDIQYNKIAYLNNSFPIDIVVIGRECSGSSSTLTLTEDSSILFTKQVTVAGNKYRQSIPVYLDAKKKGIHHYKISIAPIAGEITTTNNQKDIYVEVQETKRKVLIVADAPHPDIAALKEAIESNENYEVKVVTIDKLETNIKDQQLIILHQIPSVDHPAVDLIRSIKENGIPCLYILGSQTNISAFNLLEAGVTIRNSLNKGNETRPNVNPDFSLFTVDDGLKNAVRTFSPLLTPFGDYVVSSQGSSFLTQQIGSISTTQPLLFLGESGNTKSGVLCGEGCWRWRMNDFQLNQNFDVFNTIISKSVQYLSVHEVKGHFKILCKNSFNENEPVVMDAEVYNDNFELINSPDVAITISNREKKSFPFTFSKTEKAYSLNAGIFNPGDYHYKAQVKIGEKLYSAEGDFSVNALQVEQNETVADHQLLYSLSQKSGGQLFYPSQLAELSKLLQSKEDIKTISYSQVKLIDLVNLKAIFFLLLAMLSVEWFLRKRSGGY